MKKSQKEQQVAWLAEEFKGAKALFLTDFRSMTVAETNALRVELRKHGVRYKVLKNTLARRAYVDTDVAVIGPDLHDTRAGAWTTSEEAVPKMAKALIDFAKTHPNLILVKGMLQGRLVEVSDMDALAKMPSREELLARLLGTMKAPVGAFVNTLAAIPRGLMNVLNAIADQKSEGAPSEEVQADQQ